MSTLVIYEMDSIGANGALEAVGFHPYCSVSCRDSHMSNFLGDIKAGETDSDVAGLLCEGCGKPVLAAYAEQFPTVREGHCTIHGNWINKGECDICIKDAATLAAGETDSWDSPPVRCPYCGGTDITELEQWAAVSEDGESNETLVEWHCVNACGGRAFWV